MNAQAYAAVLRDNLKHVAYFPAGFGRLGKGDGSGTIIANLALRLAYVYEASGQVPSAVPVDEHINILALNNPALEGKRVRLGYPPYDPGRVYILGLDTGEGLQGVGGVTPTEQYTRAALFPSATNITAFRVSPDNGLTVYVNPGWYYQPSTGDLKYFAGGTITLSVAGLSAGEHKLTLVCLDAEAGTLTSVSSAAAEGSDKDFFGAGTIDGLSLSLTYLPSNAVHLVASQTIIADSDIYRGEADPRVLFSTPGAGLTSPLTTKGDLWSFDTANNRLPIGGTNGHVLQVDSAQPFGLKYATTQTALGVQVANTVLAGPTTGADAIPAFRAIVSADLTTALLSPPPIGTSTPNIGRFSYAVSTVGSYVVNDAGDADMHVRSVSGNRKQVTFATGPEAGPAYLRWLIGVTNAPESGGNAGANFGFFRYADDGSYLGSVIQSRRDNGWVSFGDYPSLTPVEFYSASVLTNAILDILTLRHHTTATPVPGLGTGLVLRSDTDGGTDRELIRVRGLLTTATDGSRKARGVLSAWDTAERDCVAWEASGAAPMVGFLGTAPIVKPSVTGNRRGVDTGLASTLTQLAALGLVTDSTTAVDERSLLTVKNTSGATATANDCGYISVDGEYKTTTTEALQGAWCVVIVGAANNSDVVVARGGRVTVALNANCSIGDFLTTSTTAGQAKPFTAVQTNLFARALSANAGGAGGTCTALLLTTRKRIPAVANTSLFYRAAASNQNGAPWTGTINGAPSGNNVTVTTSTGNINTLSADSGNIFKIVIRNTTRSNEALLVSLSGSVLTFVSVPANWASGDALTAQSDTNTDSGYYTLDCASDTNVPALAVEMEMNVTYLDSAAVGSGWFNHPYLAFSIWQAPVVTNYSTSVHSRHTRVTPLIQRRFTFKTTASGSATQYVSCLLTGFVLAEP